MNIWILKEGEPLPIFENERLWRASALAKYLSENGHKVILWSSSFTHHEKKYVCYENKSYRINDNEELFCLHSSVSYTKNMSIDRMIYQRKIGQQFKIQSEIKEKPDILLCSWPMAEFARRAIAYGKKHNVPVVLDARDQWPDIFIRAFPEKYKKLGNLAIMPFKMQAKKLFSKADGITAMIDSVLLWACNYAKRNPGENDKVIHIGTTRLRLTDDQYTESIKWWEQTGVHRKDWIICFFSTFGSHINISTVIRAVKALSKQYPTIKLVLGGSGDREAELKELAGDCNNIIFAGWLDNIKMTSLMRIAKCGAFSLRNTFDFKDTFNNKAIQYISEGLPILNSLSGFAKTFIADKQMGLTYEGDDIDDCIEKILYLHNNENMRKEMGENGLRCFNELFESNVVNKQFEEYLQMIKTKYYVGHN